MERIKLFEEAIANYYNAPYAIAVDCCTHAIELCLRYLESNNVTCPTHTYVSVPMTFEKLKLNWSFSEEKWKEYYYIGDTNIIDGAVYWKKDGYIPDSLMCLSFQYKKHLKLGRGGMILLDNFFAYQKLLKMRYDGRTNDKPWAEQDIDMLGYHYYMTPETAEEGLKQFEIVKDQSAEEWYWYDYPDLSTMKVFSAKQE